MKIHMRPKMRTSARFCVPVITALLQMACTSTPGSPVAVAEPKEQPRNGPQPLVGGDKPADEVSGNLEMQVNGSPWIASGNQLKVEISEWSNTNSIHITATHPDSTEAFWRFNFYLPYFYGEDSTFTLRTKRIGGISGQGLGHLSYAERSFRASVRKERAGDRFRLIGTFSAEYERVGGGGPDLMISGARFSAGPFKEPRIPILSTTEQVINADNPERTYGYGLSHVGRIDGQSIVLFSTVFKFKDDHGKNEVIKQRLQDLFKAYLDEHSLHPVKLSGAASVELKPGGSSVNGNRGRTMDYRSKNMEESARPLTSRDKPKRIIEVQVPDSL